MIPFTQATNGGAADDGRAATLSRREMLARSGTGLGMLALANLCAREANAIEQDLHHRPRAKQIVHLFMNGGPSHVDTFDPKPALAKYAAAEISASSMLPTRSLRPSPSPSTA